MSEDRLSAATEWVRGRVAPPPPREADDRIVTGVITAGWAVALAVVGGLAAGGVLPAGQRWWIWTCAAGLGMGLFGLWYVPGLKRRRARAAAREAQAPSEPGGGGPQPSSECRETRAGAQPSAEPSGESRGTRAGRQPSAEPSSESRDKGSNTVSSTETPGKSTRS